ncbi:flavin reductase family protein [Micromonospora sp. WMMD1082]|uniref:flavin reductase family protein n=1 Tax=Micromonospora sp. WMMD1082 TaxID=3016104 RepID=UPI002417740A|nr:flavin reductase family protein [Micromonospora sp. WMMD1082]MDG4795498.1 flavin reductase family protein [Micromonospora sp. WMMD1082]
MLPGRLTRAHRLLAPRISYLIGTRSLHGQPNLIPVSNVTSISTSPQLIIVAVFTKWTTYANLIATERFTISVPKAEQLDGVWKLGARYSRFDYPDTDAKLADSGLEINYAPDLPAPTLTDGLGYLTCRKIQEVDTGGDHGVFVGEITNVTFSRDYFDEDGTPIGDLHPLMQVTGNRFTTSGVTRSVPYGESAP